MRTIESFRRRFARVQLCACACAVVAAGCAGGREPEIDIAYPYTRPLSSPGQKFSALPPAVQSTVRSQAGAAQMYDIEKLTNGTVTYKILFDDRDIFPPLYVAPDGSVLYPESHVIAVGAGSEDFGAASGGAVGGLKLSDLPVKVVNTIQEQAPTSEVAFIQQITRNRQVYYEVSFKDMIPTLLISEDGTLAQ